MFIKRIKNVIRWLPVIWNDMDWDHHYFYVILRTKLSHMEEYIRKFGHHLGNEKDADDMKIAINTIDRLIEDEYLENALKWHKEKWGSVDIKFIPVTDDDSGCSTAEFVYDKANTEKDKEQARKEFKIAADHSEYMIGQDLDFLFNFLRKKIRHWWD